MAENGRKKFTAVIWQKMDFRAFLHHGHRGSQAGNGRKWWKMDFRGKMVENGFPRVSRHSPTTHQPLSFSGISFIVLKISDSYCANREQKDSMRIKPINHLSNRNDKMVYSTYYYNNIYHESIHCNSICYFEFDCCKTR